MGPTERFSTRAGYYARYRPGYPGAVVDTLECEAGLRPGAVVADIGAGTGISSALFLRRGYAVTAVEPNAEMRAKAVEALGADLKFRALSGTAEDTGLPAVSMDAVVCAQAFHWFRLEESRAEFRRILKPGGAIAVMWNLRKRSASAFMEGLEALLYEHCPSYADHVTKDTTEAVAHAAALAENVHAHVFEWIDPLDRETLLGRMLSASYVPMDGPANRAVVEGLHRLFDQHSDGGRIGMLYETKLFWSR